MMSRLCDLLAESGQHFRQRWNVILWVTVLFSFSVQAQVDELKSDTDYVLGPGDQIQIHVHGEEDLSVKVRLEEDGYLSYPFLGELKVGGETVDELQAKITSGLRGDYLLEPDVRVYVLEYRPVYVNGEVKKPGGYPYVPGLTVQKAITLAGGFTDFASKGNMYVVPESQTTGSRQSVDMDARIGPGDTLIVEEGFF